MNFPPKFFPFFYFLRFLSFSSSFIRFSRIVNSLSLFSFGVFSCLCLFFSSILLLLFLVFYLYLSPFTSHLLLREFLVLLLVRFLFFSPSLSSSSLRPNALVLPLFRQRPGRKRRHLCFSFAWPFDRQIRTRRFILSPGILYQCKLLLLLWLWWLLLLWLLL